jgi:hypothetical protein
MGVRCFAVGELEGVDLGADEVVATPFEVMAEVGVLVVDGAECLLKRRVQKTWMQSWRLTMQKPCKCSMRS